MRDTSKLLKNSVIYLLGNVLSKMLTFLMLPLYTKYISPADYGYYDLANTYVNLIATVMCFEIWSTIMRYMLDKEYRDNKAKPVTNGLTIYLGSTILIVLIFIGVNSVLHLQYASLILLYGISLCLHNLYGYIARGYGLNTLFAVSGVVSTLINASLNILLIIVLHVDYKSLYIAYIVSVVVQCLILESKVHLFGTVSINLFDRKLFFDMLKFTLPLCLNTGAFWFLTSYGKTVVSTNLSVADNGYYSVASKFGLIIQLVSSCFIASWQELAFAKGKTAANDDYYEYMLGLFIKYLFVASCLILPCVFIVFPIMIDSQYSQAVNIVPIYLLATMLNAFSSFLTAIFGAIKKTKVLFTSTLIGCLVNIILVHVLIEKIGIHAASVSMFFGFLVCVIIRIIILKKSIRLKLDMKRIACLYIPLLCVSVAVYFTGNMLYNVILLVLLFVLSVYVCRDEVTQVVSVVSKERRK